MTQEEIKAERDKLYQKLSECRKLERRIQLELKILMNECGHPNKYETIVMGEDTVRCPDCGYSR